MARRIANPELSLNVPHLVDLEVVQALRRYVREREIDASDARLMLSELRALDLQRHAAKNRLVDPNLAVEIGQLAAVDAEIGQPVGPLLVPVDRIGQLLLVPQSADEHFAAELADKIGNRAAKLPRILGIFVGIQDHHAFVDVLGQVISPRSFAICHLSLVICTALQGNK